MRGGGTVTASTNRSGIDVRLLLVVAIALVLGLAAAGAWALTTNNDLESTRATLASTSGDLDAAKGDLTESTAALDATTADLAAARDAIKKDQAKATSLNFQIERKGACIAAQAANLAEIRRILALERVDFARTGSTSAWGRAHSAAQKAINLAIDDLDKAYQNAAAGRYGTANTWIDKSNAQIRVSNSQLKKEDKQVDAINKSTDATNGANDAFTKTLDETSSTCGA